MCVSGVSVFLSVSPPRVRVNEAVYRRLAQLVGAGDEHLDPRTLGAIVNKRLVGSGGEWRRQLSSVNEPPCLSLELSTAAPKCPRGPPASQHIHDCHVS